MAGTISSIKDDHLRQVRVLASRTGRHESGACLLEGATLIEHALDTGAALRFAIHAEAAGDPVSARLTEAAVAILEARESILRKAVGLSRPVRWIAVADLAEATDDMPYGEFAVVLDNVLDPGNLGTIVRTAVGLGVVDVVCAGEDIDLTSRRVVDASRAAVLRARIRRFASPVNAVEALRARGFEIVATSGRGPTMQGLAQLTGRPVALVVGNETTGVSDDVLALADHVVRIPMSSDVESLNVGVATGISLYELRTRALLTALRDHARASLVAELGEAVDATLAELDRTVTDTDHLTGDQLAVLVTLLADPTADPARTLGRDVTDATAELVRAGYLDQEVTPEGRQVVAGLWSPL
ncbi:MAG: RNA methyltransferase, partial [Kutzneria sp.]|nr:RNA methyltransferase [Kutzneria sp.]